MKIAVQIVGTRIEYKYLDINVLTPKTILKPTPLTKKHDNLFATACLQLLYCMVDNELLCE